MRKINKSFSTSAVAVFHGSSCFHPRTPNASLMCHGVVDVKKSLAVVPPFSYK